MAIVPRKTGEADVFFENLCGPKICAESKDEIGVIALPWQ
jgi:hypothetical protein